MKTVGLAMLFALCCAIGFRIGALKTARLRTVRTLRGDLQLLTARISSGIGSLMEIASDHSGMLCGALDRYLHALSQGETEADAANRAAEGLRKESAEHDGIRMFFSGLSQTGRAGFSERAETLSRMLEQAEKEAETEAKQARIIRASGALIGTAIAILLL